MAAVQNTTEQKNCKICEKNFTKTAIFRFVGLSVFQHQMKEPYQMNSNGNEL